MKISLSLASRVGDEMANEMKFNEAREHNKRRRIVAKCHFLSLSTPPRAPLSDTAQAGDEFFTESAETS